MSRDPQVSAILAIAERLSDVGDNPAARQLQGEVNRLRDRAVALDTVNNSRNPAVTDAGHALNVAKQARKFDPEITAALNRAVIHYANGKADIERRIAEKLNLKPDAAWAVAIASRFSALSGKAQAKLLQDLIDGNRGPELAAILTAPASLTGLNARQIENYRHAFASAHAAAELDQIAKLDDAFEAFNVAEKAAGALVKGFTDPGRLARIEREAAAAEEAGAAFAEALQPQ